MMKLGAQAQRELVKRPVAELAGVGPKRAAALADRGIATALDVLLNLPSHYQDLRERRAVAEVVPATTVTVEGELEGVTLRPVRGMGWRRRATGWLVDLRGDRIRTVWFNLPGAMRGGPPGVARVIAHGAVSRAPDGALELVHPEIFRLDSGPPPPVRPVYRLPAGIGQRLYANLVREAFGTLEGEVEGAIPHELCAAEGIVPMGRALMMLHFPAADSDIARLNARDSEAHRAIALDELFAFEFALCLERSRAARRRGIVLCASPTLSRRFLDGLAFAPTGAQRAAMAEIDGDLESPRQMNRLLMGDVGSGKTLVAIWAALRAVESGYQAALMAPTELLAEQHFRSFLGLCPHLGVNATLLTGAVAGAVREKTVRGLACGEVQIVFGTQALIQAQVRIPRLGLAVIDEQHRFGVFDRARLKALSPAANVLLMTATPIPRSLALALFANLDVSFLDELPPGRTSVATELFDEDEIVRVHEAARAQLSCGHRAYYVLPFIEGEGEDERLTVTAMAEQLGCGALGGFRVGLMHGRMRSVERERVMRDFRDGALDALVATTVVEVGIDVPEATAIVIMGAERYGLAQLHQLRGRVGRGRAPSRCFLVVSRGADARARERLQVLVRTASGAEVARADLAMRGPGDLLGARQTGALPLRFAAFIPDHEMIARSRSLAEQWLARDPGVESAASAGLRLALSRMMDLGFSLGDVG